MSFSLLSLKQIIVGFLLITIFFLSIHLFQGCSPESTCSQGGQCWTDEQRAVHSPAPFLQFEDEADYLGQHEDKAYYSGPYEDEADFTTGCFYPYKDKGSWTAEDEADY